MIELELQLVRENPRWLTVLCAYQSAHEELSQQTEVTIESADDADPSEESATEDETPSEEPRAARFRKAIWLPRLTMLDGIESEELSRIHGRLIAYDLLKCDLADRSAGVVYQLTSTARQVMTRLSDEHDTELNAAA